MTEINFYVSKERGLEHRLAIVYRLITLALQRNLNIYIHTESEALSTKVDDYLWSNERASFIPHCVVNSDSAKTPVKQLTKNTNNNCYEINISHGFEPLENCDYLINLSTQRPSFFSRFLKVAEILDNDEEIITAGRKRYSFYRDRGYTLGYHKL